MRKYTSDRVNAGFTLIELTVVLMVITAVMGSIISLMSASLEGKSYNSTIAKMQLLQQAIADYRIAYNRLPCPANSSAYNPGDANYGREAANKGTCISGTPDSDIGDATAAVGMVPVRTLGLPDDMAIDYWGRRIRYAVSPAFTIDDAFDGTGATAVATSTTARIAVNNNDSATNVASTALFVLVSYGKNGHGSRGGSKGTLLNASITNANELLNCKCLSSGAQNGGADLDSFAQGNPKPDPANRFNDFDDIVLFSTRAQLRDANE